MQDVTQLLQHWVEGDGSAFQRLIPLVYDELRAVAGNLQKHGGSGATLQPTALVHEAYVRLARIQNPGWSGRGHFLAVAAKAMRQLIVDHARARLTDKRGGGLRPLTLDTSLIDTDAPDATDVMALEEALAKLTRLDERKARVVEMRFFGGMTNDEVAQVLDIARSTVADDWAFARAWLAEELSGGTP
jgi:RNA polymerase sigma factor (TIGR02999 family)